MKKLFLDAVSLCISLFGAVVVFIIFVVIGSALGFDNEFGFILGLAMLLAFLSFFFIARAVFPFMRREYLND